MKTQNLQRKTLNGAKIWVTKSQQVTGFASDWPIIAMENITRANENQSLQRKT